MSLKAGRVGVDPKYVDATGKPVIGPDPGPKPSVDAVEWVKAADNTTPFEWIFEANYPYLIAATTSTSDMCCYMINCNGTNFNWLRLQTTGNAPNLSFSRDGNKLKVTASSEANIYILMKAPASTTKAVTTRKTVKKTAK